MLAGMLVATHSGPFHADDVFAGALLRVFVDPTLTFVRTREAQKIDAADVAIDVGERYEPGAGRFDHHQRSYGGALSSAGMVLGWLEAEGHVERQLALLLREEWVAYIDAVDCGRERPDRARPCICTLVSAIGERAETAADFDQLYEQAVQVCQAVLVGVAHGQERSREAEAVVASAMENAERKGSRVLRFDRGYKWKRAYFERGGAGHPTDYVMFPDGETWRLLAIPPEAGSLAQKRPLPAEWAGLSGDALSAVTGVPGSRFCHKNRFIAVFENRASIEEALVRWGLESGSVR